MLDICFLVKRLIYAFWYLSTYVTYAKILAHVCDHVRRFYINCQSLSCLTLQNSPLQIFAEVKSTQFYVCKKKKKMISLPSSCHDCLRNFIINEEIIVRSYMSLFLGACLSKTSVKIVGNASNPFSFRNLPCI